jgi:anthranilate synthase component 2
MVLLIDNYDSFSYNLYQLIGAIEPDIRVVRNDSVSIEEIERLKPSHIVLSPGPGRPENAGICIDAIKYFAGRLPILGVCLGHQAVCEAFGSPVVYAKKQIHGKPSVIKIDNKNPLFIGLKEETVGARYHSLVADPKRISEELSVIGTADGEIMAVRHKACDVYGVQFHPESILTENGGTILRNFLNI